MFLELNFSGNNDGSGILGSLVSMDGYKIQNGTVAGLHSTECHSQLSLKLIRVDQNLLYLLFI